MYSNTELAFKYLNYTCRASNGKGHGIHSPFVYDLVDSVLNDDRDFYSYSGIEQVKAEWEKDQRIIRMEDFGGRSEQRSSSEKKIADIARRSVSSEKFGRLLFRMVNHYQSKQIIELGTSLGISTAYLASANPGSNLITLEGSSAIARIAAETFKKLNLPHIQQVTGNFSDTLPRIIASSPPADLIFIDGNHRKEPLLNYFHQFLSKKSPSAIFILHDIHWSREMEEAWQIIREQEEVLLSIDIFSAGLIFFRDSFRVKQHFIIRF